MDNYTDKIFYNMFYEIVSNRLVRSNMITWLSVFGSGQTGHDERLCGDKGDWEISHLTALHIKNFPTCFMK